MDATTVSCPKCKKEFIKTNSNCCWLNCCELDFCGMCGSENINSIDGEDLDLSDGSDDNYWCCLYCEECGLNGCGMCV